MELQRPICITVSCGPIKSENQARKRIQLIYFSLIPIITVHNTGEYDKNKVVIQLQEPFILLQTSNFETLAKVSNHL